VILIPLLLDALSFDLPFKNNVAVRYLPGNGFGVGTTGLCGPRLGTGLGFGVLGIVLYCRKLAYSDAFPMVSMSRVFLLFGMALFLGSCTTGYYDRPPES
jgi:hypothetical protein